MLNEHVRKSDSTGENLLHIMDIGSGNLKRNVKLYLKGDGPGCEKRHWKWPPIFFVTVRHLWYSGTWTIIFGNHVALPTSPSAGYWISL
jgi:hypothetical protein